MFSCIQPEYLNSIKSDLVNTTINLRPFVHQIRCYDSVFFEEAVLMVADWMDASEIAKRFTTSKNFVIVLNNKTNKS